ncbi:uncharacterized protein LOC124307804 [Neodiprion virginianus]|uniref:uncharacterized protein LOC124307804 n=1 Tax=Neodiprion virginianus TaxID=2961670 RepID=UPI001EE6B7D2|nr:uncharacterized protein LOC124307804 [Neodiprion virginianus]
MEAKAVICLLCVCVQSISSDRESLENTATAVETDSSEVDFKRLENEYAVGNVSERIRVSESNSSTLGIREEISADPSLTPKTDGAGEFKPSVHLGEIEEFESGNAGPFNKPNHLNFENFLSVQPETQDWPKTPSTKNETNNLSKNYYNYNVNSPSPEPGFFPSAIAGQNQYFRPPAGTAGLSFGHSSPSYQAKNIPKTFQSSPLLPPPFQRPDYSPTSPDKTSWLDNPPPRDISQQFEYPSSPYRDEANFVTPFDEGKNFEYEKPPPSFDGVEFPVTKSHRFPYKFYQEGSHFSDSSFEYLPDDPVVHTSPRERRVSPWKKIVQLIGTILPFGLLLATLSPNIIQIGNSTESSIPLSKLKDLNLPPEHKSLRMEELISCEEKNICEMILAGSKPKSNMFQNILWNFATRTSEETAKDNGLRELFQSVKKRDCNLITC